MIILPESGFSRPFKQRINVDLPAPLKPMTQDRLEEILIEYGLMDLDEDYII